MDKTIETLKVLRDQMLAYTTEGDAVFYSEESAGKYATALDALLSRVGELEAENAKLQKEVAAASIRRKQWVGQVSGRKRCARSKGASSWPRRPSYNKSLQRAGTHKVLARGRAPSLHGRALCARALLRVGVRSLSSVVIRRTQ
jgi:hypothetical protein